MISILKETEEGREIVKSFMERQEAFLEDEERIAIIQLLVSHLIKDGSEVDLYPRAEKKAKLAQAICEAFPCLGIVVDGINYSTHFYNQKDGTGFIEARLKRLRRVLHSTKRQRVGRLVDNSNKGKKKTRKHPPTRTAAVFDQVKCDYMVCLIILVSHVYKIKLICCGSLD